MSATTLTDLTTGATGFIQVEWTNADEGPNHYSWRVYHRSGTKPYIRVYETLASLTNYSLNSYAWANGVSQEFVAVAVSQDPGSGALTEAARTGGGTVTPTGDNLYTLVHPTDPGKTLQLAITVADSYEQQTEHEVIPLLSDTNDQGGGYKINRGYTYGRTGSISAQILDSAVFGTAAAQLQALEDAYFNGEALFLRDPFGGLIKIFIGSVSIDRMPGIGIMEGADVSFPYTQII